MPLELQPVKRRVSAALGQQLLMAAGFYHRSVLNHENAIGVHDRGEPMSNGDGCASLAQFSDCFLHQVFGFGIQRRSRLIEQDDRRILDQCARDRDTLALAARKLHPVLANGCVIASRKSNNEFMRLGGLRGRHDLSIARVEFTERNVLADRPMEQMNDLADKSDLLAQRTPRYVDDVLVVDQNASRNRHRRSAGLG